ncbi:MAG TPA: pitrilysin family protein [Candidatus Acidoferrales bacterium]|nr:pitrilysin family protein [Candidatus Acidoferrales bacterium]
MSLKLPLLAVCAALVLCGQPARKIFPYDYAQEDLPNGLRLITVPTDYPNIVATYIVVQTGSRNEVEPGLTGFAHLFEHLMFRGTPKISPEQYNQTLNRIGAASNASTSSDFTVYHTTFSKEDLETVMIMEADRFQHLKFAEPEFKTESLAVLGEYNKNSSAPGRKLNEALHETAFQRHTYRHTAMGFLKDIQDMPNHYDYSLKFFDRYYRPEYTTVIVVGDVQPKPVRALVDRYWGEWKRGSFHPDIPAEPPQDEALTGHVPWPTATMPLIAIAYKAPAYNDTTPDTAALDALNQMAFSQSSELYQRLVVREQKADSLSGSAQPGIDPDLFAITARVKKAGDVAYVRERILETVKAFREKPVEAGRLDRVRKRLRYELALSMDNSDTIAAILSYYVALRRTPETLNTLFEQYQKLTPEDVQQAAQKYLVENASTTVTLTGPGGAQ